ncbi:MAG: hypothetical protein OSA99_09385 [Acidimicrobiales bacterium]|nr:hypothetical protein [Acidimicrobiales bacterium]
MVNVRVLAAMTLGALVAALGALFLGEYEFDELLPIVAGPLLALIVAEVVVSIGRHRSKTMAAILATWGAVAVLLAGHLDTNGIEAIKAGAYLSAGLSAIAAGLRGNDWIGDYRARSSSTTHDARSTAATREPLPDS